MVTHRSLQYSLMPSRYCFRCVITERGLLFVFRLKLLQGRDLAAISPTGTGKTLSYLIPIMASLKSPLSSSKQGAGLGVRAIILSPTRELAHQIHNECMKLAQGRKWRIVLLNKATASTLANKSISDKVGQCK